VIVSVIERRRRLQIERREQVHTFAAREEFLVLGPAAVAFSDIPGEENDNGM
jgi:hypothetical protein